MSNFNMKVYNKKGYGMLCTVVVETWHPGAVYPVATVLLVSALMGQVAMSMAVRIETRRS